MGKRQQEEENYWPGFVDALSTIVMVVTFVMIILAIVIITLSSADHKKSTNEDAGYSKSAASQKEGSVNQSIVQDSEKESGETEERNSPESGNISKATAESPGRKIVEKKALTPQGPEKVEGEENKVNRVPGSEAIVELEYDEETIDLSSELTAEIHEYVRSIKDSIGNNNLTIKSYAHALSGSYSQSRRLGFYRAMLMRNFFIENGINGENITVEVEVTDGDKTANKVVVYAE